MDYANENKKGQQPRTSATPNYAAMSDDEIYEYLEIKYGPYFALSVVEEMRKVKKAA